MPGELGKDFRTIDFGYIVKGLIGPQYIPLDFLLEKVTPKVGGKTPFKSIHHFSFLLRLKKPLPVVVVYSKDRLGAKRLDVFTLVVYRKKKTAAIKN